MLWGSDTSEHTKCDQWLNRLCSFRTLVAAQPQAFVFETCEGDSFKSELKLAAMKAAVRKHGTSGNCRISLFGTLVGWLHEQSYIPQAWKGLNGGRLFLKRGRGGVGVQHANKPTCPGARTKSGGKKDDRSFPCVSCSFPCCVRYRQLTCIWRSCRAFSTIVRINLMPGWSKEMGMPMFP